MPTLSERGRDFLVRGQQQAASVAVKYLRIGGAEPLELVAVPGLSVASTDSLPGRVEIAQRDYLVAVADLVDENECPRLPQHGDRITETIAGVECTFELQPPDNGEPAWRYSSQWRSTYRLHMKRVKA